MTAISSRPVTSTIATHPPIDLADVVPVQGGGAMDSTPAATEVTVTAVPSAANGVPTSVFGFALVVLMLSLVNTGILSSGRLLVPLFVSIGFVTIGVGGLVELRNGDIFGGTFGVVYSTFLLATGISLKFFAPAAGADTATTKAFGEELGSLFLIGALVSVVFTIGARLVNTTAVIAFALLTVVLLLAGLGNAVGGDIGANLVKTAGYVGLLDGLAAFWLATGVLLNTMHDRELVKL